jgi:hypothetical protein
MDVAGSTRTTSAAQSKQLIDTGVTDQLHHGEAIPSLNNMLLPVSAGDY